QHTAINIAEGIEAVMYKLDINKFIAVITDNAPNIKAAWCILKTFVSLINKLEEDRPLLSVAFLKLQQLEVFIYNNTYVPNSIIVKNIQFAKYC
ncbi:7760_t:CDS:2, partial [Dentiscutata erythropus]